MGWMNLRTVCVLVAASLRRPRQLRCKRRSSRAPHSQGAGPAGNPDPRGGPDRRQRDPARPGRCRSWQDRPSCRGSTSTAPTPSTTTISRSSCRPARVSSFARRRTGTASIDLRQTLFYRSPRLAGEGHRQAQPRHRRSSTAGPPSTTSPSRSHGRFYDAVALAEWVEVREIVLEENRKPAQGRRASLRGRRELDRRCRPLAGPGGCGQSRR